MPLPGGYLLVDLSIWDLILEISSHQSWTKEASTGGVDLPVDLPIFALTLEISCHHSWPLDASTRGVPAGCSLNLSSNSRNLKSQFLTTRCLYWGVDLSVNRQIWALTVEISSHHSWSLDASTRGVPAGCSLNMSSNSRNFKSQYLTTRCLYWGVDLPVNRPIWAQTVEISSHHYWPLEASTGG